MLRSGNHPNDFMQSVFNKHGHRFEPEVIATAADPEALIQMEQEWLDRNFGKPGCVNLSGSAQYNPDFEKTCLTLSEKAKKRFEDPAEREKVAAPKGMSRNRRRQKPRCRRSGGPPTNGPLNFAPVGANKGRVEN